MGVIYFEMNYVFGTVHEKHKVSIKVSIHMYIVTQQGEFYTHLAVSPIAPPRNITNFAGAK